MRALFAAVLISGSGTAHDALRAQCLLNASNPKNPWALAHGITAFGPSFLADDGRRATQVIVSDFLRKGTDPATGTWAFERYGPDGTPIEPHTNLLLKTLVLSGVKDVEAFQTPQGSVTIGELVRSAQRGFRHTPESEEYWRDAGWTLDLLAARLSPKAARFQNGAGQTVDLNRVMDDALAQLEWAQRELSDGMAKGLPQVPKRKQGIYAHPCGGLHLFQAVASWARFPEVRKKWGERFDRQVAVLFYRLDSEQRQYDAALQQAPQYALQILTQMVKFHGHFLETAGRLRVENGWKPTASQERAVAKSKAVLEFAVRELQQLHAFQNMDELKKSQPQVYLDLIGDSCHAVHGLSYWR
jgi:hypothetical protein